LAVFALAAGGAFADPAKVKSHSNTNNNKADQITCPTGETATTDAAGKQTCGEVTATPLNNRQNLSGEVTATPLNNRSNVSGQSAPITNTKNHDSSSPN
jgi:hypothetical protein